MSTHQTAFWSIVLLFPQYSVFQAVEAMTTRHQRLRPHPVEETSHQARRSRRSRAASTI